MVLSQCVKHSGIGMRSGLKALCLDIEGGFGGSSRSLYYLIKHLPPERARAEVWCKRQGPIQRRYDSSKIPATVEPCMPKASSLPKFSRNILIYAQAGLDFAKAHKNGFLFRLGKAAAESDLVHFNHEGLFLLASWLKRNRPNIANCMHIRTRPQNTTFARWQMRCISNSVGGVVFITENERDHFRRLGGRSDGQVIYNVVEPPHAVDPLPELEGDNRFKVLSLSNFSLERGTDRLMDIALVLHRMGRKDVVIVAAGDMKLSRNMPGELGAAARAGKTFVDIVAAKGLSENIIFLGHVPYPERLLASCHALIKPARGKSPWGRDILEAMASGKPVLATGNYKKFVRHVETGFLYPEFDAQEFARDLILFADHPSISLEMGAKALKVVENLCHGPTQAGKLLDLWYRLTSVHPM